jgi:hypothetical protein
MVSAIYASLPRLVRSLLSAAAIAILLISPAAASDADAIRQLLLSTFDKPDARLAVDPVVIAGNYAVAGWSQGDTGGRALLRQRAGQWAIVLCSGDALKTGEALRRGGVPEAGAKLLAARLAEAEAKLPPERVALFARFDGIVMMDASGAHPHH